MLSQFPTLYDKGLVVSIGFFSNRIQLRSVFKLKITEWEVFMLSQFPLSGKLEGTRLKQNCLHLYKYAASGSFR